MTPPDPLPSRGAHDTHRRFFNMVIRNGTEEERADALETMRLLREWRLAFPGSFWEPMERLTLPSFLISRAERVARKRQARAARFSLDNKFGVTRSLEEEIRTVEGQTACCLMLGLPLGEATTHQQAKKEGNIGGNISVFVPRPGRYSLLIDEDEKPKRWMFLVAPEGDHEYSCLGWIRAGEVMTPEYQRTFVRRGVTSRPYIVPTDVLSHIRSWFGG